MYTLEQQLVSVPLRGLWFLTVDKAETRYKEISFRPLTGFMVLNGYLGKIEKFDNKFPSPYGVYGS